MVANKYCLSLNFQQNFNLIQAPTQADHSSLFSEQVPFTILDPDVLKPLPATLLLPCASYTDSGNQDEGSSTKPIVSACHESPSSSQTRIYESHMQFGTIGILQDYTSASPSVFLPDPCPHLRPPRPPPPRPSWQEVLSPMDYVPSATKPLNGMLIHLAPLQPSPLFDTGRKRKLSAAEIPGNLKTSVQ